MNWIMHCSRRKRAYERLYSCHSTSELTQTSVPYSTALSLIILSSTSHDFSADELEGGIKAWPISVYFNKTPPQIHFPPINKKLCHVKSNPCNRRQRRYRFRAGPTSRWERPHSLPCCKEWECWKSSSVRSFFYTNVIHSMNLFFI